MYIPHRRLQKAPHSMLYMHVHSNSEFDINDLSPPPPPPSPLDKLIRQIGLKKSPEVVDLTGSKVMVESLTETKIMCTAEDKVFCYKHVYTAACCPSCIRNNSFLCFSATFCLLTSWILHSILLIIVCAKGVPAAIRWTTCSTQNFTQSERDIPWTPIKKTFLIITKCGICHNIPLRSFFVSGCAVVLFLAALPW